MILVYTEFENGTFKKSALELISYAKALTNDTKQVVALTINATGNSILSQYGANKIISVNNSKLNEFTAQAYAATILQVAEKENADTIVLSTSPNARYIAPILAIRWGGVYLSNITSLPIEKCFKKTLFASKAIGNITTSCSKKVITLSGNAFGIHENPVSPQIVDFEPELPEDLFAIKTLENQKNKGNISIAEASIVVSGGRGLKAAENWYIIEELADVLGAATACTKPVSDMGWRPHSEHVGQTGKPVACDLYIAIGISGAIQHLAGVHNSKVKVVINSDPEAPFFKAADYGIVGDAFDVVPKLIEKIKLLN